MAAVHGKGRFAEGDFCCPWGPFLWLLDPGGGTAGCTEVLWDAAGCMGGGTKPLCSHAVHSGQPQGWDGETTARAAAGLQGLGVRAMGQPGRRRHREGNYPFAFPVLPAQPRFLKITCYVPKGVCRWLSLWAPGAFLAQGGGRGCPFVGGSPETDVPSPQVRDGPQLRQHNSDAAGVAGGGGEGLSLGGLEGTRGAQVRTGKCQGGQVWAVRGSQSSTPLPSRGRCQEEPAVRQSWADSAGWHAAACTEFVRSQRAGLTPASPRPSSYPDELGPKHWSDKRYENLMRLKQEALAYAREQRADYILVRDVGHQWGGG